jgi:hypothetical protein
MGEGKKTYGGRDWTAYVLTEEKSVEQIFPLRKFAGHFCHFYIFILYL